MNDKIFAWMAEGSKAVDLSSILFGGVGSNPTPSNNNFFKNFIYNIKIVIIINKIYCAIRESNPGHTVGNGVF